MSDQEIGIALRYGVFSPDDVCKTVQILDDFHGNCRVFVPDGRAGYESLQTVSAILTQTRRIQAGSGVIRLLEHDPLLLVRRVQTIQAFSANRFFLGVGTGSPGAEPVKIIELMLQRLEEVKSSFSKYPSVVKAPEVWVAALRLGIARKIMRNADGLVLNFCTPEHVSRILSGLDKTRPEALRIGCYLKLFYSSTNDLSARRLLVQEFLNYDSIPHYHQMFMQDRTSRAIAQFRENNDWRRSPFVVPEELLKVSLANPTSDELRMYLEDFRNAGVDLPVIYPYFPEDEKQSFKLETITKICDGF